jgi:hypothetical protein
VKNEPKEVSKTYLDIQKEFHSNKVFSMPLSTEFNKERQRERERKSQFNVKIKLINSV